ncbi:MAG: GNAT family N-acetyltransferase [Flavisolibacter sp.]|nr:GNAT family N-acetyltransferase [Flavisolibacter sp.]
MIDFQQLAPSDAAFLSGIGGTSLLESHGHSAPSEIMQEYVGTNLNREACRNELSDPKNIFYAIYHKNEAAGYFKIICKADNPVVQLKPVTKLERLYLLKPFYGLNLGNLLLQKAVDLSKGCGDQGMWLNVWKENQRAIRFYQKKGFSAVGETVFLLTATHANPNWVMVLEY